MCTSQHINIAGSLHIITDSFVYPKPCLSKAPSSEALMIEPPSPENIHNLTDIHVVIRLPLIVLLHDIRRDICGIQRLTE